MLQPPVHLKFGGKRRKLEAEAVHVEAIEGPFDAHKKQAGMLVLMLIRMDNVRAPRIKQARDAGDQPFSIRTIYQ